MLENCMSVSTCCRVTVLYFTQLRAGSLLWFVCVALEPTESACACLMILHWAHERSDLSSPFPLLHQCRRRFLSPNYLRASGLHAILPSLPASARRTEKGIAVLPYSNNNHMSRRNINPCKTARGACWDGVPQRAVITEEKKRKVKAHPHPNTT